MDVMAGKVDVGSGVMDAGAGKRAGKQQQADTNEFATLLSTTIKQMEEKMATAGTAKERDSAKQLKKQLREVLRDAQNTSMPPEERLASLQAKYSQLAQDVIRLEKQQAQTQESLDSAMREREKAQDSLRRSNMLRDKLEELCRQLQKENKEVMEENRRVREEEAALQSRMQTAVADITQKIEAQAADRAAQMAENETLRGKLRDVLTQFDTFNSLIAKKDEETNLMKQQLEQQGALVEALTQRNSLLESANTQLLDTSKKAHAELEVLVQAQAANAALVASNQALRDQLDGYHTKFAEFQDTLTKSNAVFAGLKKEMDAGGKLRAALMRERDELRRRVEAAEGKLVETVTSEQALKQQVARLSAQVAAVEGVDAEEVRRLKGQCTALEGLCRGLRQQMKGDAAGPGLQSQDDEKAATSEPATGEEAGALGVRAITSPRSPRVPGHGRVEKGEACPAPADATTDNAKPATFGGVLLPN